jgi:branched-chain amino acid transport system permease protein
MLAAVFVALTAIWLLLNKTSFGRVVRAGVQRPDMVAVLGIRLQPYMTTIVVLGVGLAALAGVLFAPISGVHPAMGAEIMTAAFVVVVIGGLGSFWGVVIAALLVGVVRGITIHFYPAAGEASTYILMLLVLLFRPRGLLGERIERFE